MTRTGFVLALAYPLTPRGIRATARSLSAALRPQPAAPARGLAAIAVLAAAYLTGGWGVVLCGVLLPRLLLYPQLAWMSLIVEHTWFDPDRRVGTAVHVEAGRCLRLYPRNPLLAALAATTWLPYGDLHHFAHSAHPALRWNYLPAAEHRIGSPHFTPHALLLGAGSITARHHRALNTAEATTQTATPQPRTGAAAFGVGAAQGEPAYETSR